MSCLYGFEDYDHWGKHPYLRHVTRDFAYLVLSYLPKTVSTSGRFSTPLLQALSKGEVYKSEFCDNLEYFGYNPEHLFKWVKLMEAKNEYTT